MSKTNFKANNAQSAFATLFLIFLSLSYKTIPVFSEKRTDQLGDNVNSLGRLVTVASGLSLHYYANKTAKGNDCSPTLAKLRQVIYYYSSNCKSHFSGNF